MEMATQHFERTLWTAPGKTAREYLLGRGFKKETLEKVRAGAARDSWDDLLGALRGQFAPRALLAAGLVLERQGKDGHYDRFRNRAVFPILGESGKVVAFGARSLDGRDGLTGDALFVLVSSRAEKGFVPILRRDGVAVLDVGDLKRGAANGK